MIYAKGAVKPVYEVMQQAGEKFDQNAYVPAVAVPTSNTCRMLGALPAR